MTIFARTTVIRNAHPRLRFSRRALARMIQILDGHFFESPLERGLSAEASAKADGVPPRRNRGVSAVPPGELSLVFLTDSALAKVHADFMADPSATDVITFAGDPASGLAGEICVSADTAARYVGAALDAARGRPRGTPLQAAFSAELTLYLVHGWLHLAGYDDLQPAKKRRMRAAEKRAMTLLRGRKALPVFRFA